MANDRTPALPAGHGDAVDEEQGVDGAPRRRFALPVLLLGSFMGVLDPFVVTVALPAIRSDLGASAAQTQWMVAGYGAVYGIGLIVGGRLGDRYGRRRLFLIGMGTYVVASAAAGAAPAVGVLVGVRLAQGLAAAAMLPQVLSIIRAGYPEPARSRAVGWYGMTVGLGVVSGPALGGLLVGMDVAGLGWRTIFIANVPLGLAVVAGAALAVPASRARGAVHLDLVGSALGAAALLAFFVPVSQGADAGWRWWMIALLAAAPVLLVVFLVHERRVERRGRTPAVPLRLFGERRFARGMTIILLLYVAGMGAPFIFVLSYYLQDGLGQPPLRTGIVLVPIGIGFAAASAIAPRLYRRLGVLVPVCGNAVVAACLAGLALTAVTAPGWLPPALLMPVLLLAGLGQGLATNPIITLVLAAAPESFAGSASALLLTATQVGNILGVTLIGSVFFALLPAGGTGTAAYSTALAWALGLLAVLTLVTAVVVLTLRREPG